MNDQAPSSSFKLAVAPDESLAIQPDILAWFKQRGAGWQDEINGVLEFYRDTVEHPASEPGHKTTGPEPGPA